MILETFYKTIGARWKRKDNVIGLEIMIIHALFHVTYIFFKVFLNQILHIIIYICDMHISTGCLLLFMK